MKATTVTETKVILEMTEEESQWLKLVMQNPLHGQTPIDESSHDAAMRKAFFEAIKPIRY